MDQPLDAKKILCIDDTPQVRTLVRRLLSAQYVIVEADDGLQGIDLAQQDPPDLVLVDLHMPHLTGYEVATRIKSFLPDVPIVALTADVTEHVRERALASGCDGYLSKPLDPDAFLGQVEGYLGGAREELADESFRDAYQQTLVVRLEEKVRELSLALERNAELNRQNLQLLEKAQRRARLLEAGAQVSRTITSILNLDELLSTTVDVICDEFGFYYAGVFLVDETKRWAVLRAGRGEAGAAMVDEGHRLEIGGHSMVGLAIQRREARIALDVGEEPVHFKNPYLPHTRSEMALPLVIGVEAVGALTVQSVEEAAFSDDDVHALQAMADQLAAAISNARLLKDLEAAHNELVRTKTYEAIAAATGEAIHWVGNKAAPIPGSVARIMEDVTRYLCAAQALLAELPPELQEHPYAQLFAQAAQEMAEHGIAVPEVQQELAAYPGHRLHKVLNVSSILEDLAIIQKGARAILNIKEDLIGPVRQRQDVTVDLPELLRETVASMGIPAEHVRMLFSPAMPAVLADPVQLNRVFVNLIKNAIEAMEGVEDKKLFIWGREADEAGFVVVDIIDNGVGIPPDQIDKIWMAFYTTKGDRGGTGLGLPACAQIVSQLQGKIVVESEVGLGTTFSVYLPVLSG
ncbi:MAG: response regulator [Anaerolineae bacterium]|nr:response regulator [Anaerolineae bacterium]